MLIVLALFYLVKAVTQGAGDFSVYYGAANDIRQGKPIYFVDYFVGTEPCSYSYPPFFAMLLILLTALPLPVADTLWLLLNIFLLFRIFKIIDNFLETRSLFSVKTYRLWIFLVLLFTVRFILYNFDLSQSTIIILWGCIESLNLTLKNRFVLSGLLLATVISIKLMPLVMLPYFFYRGFFRSGLWTLLFLVLLNLLPAAFYGFQNYLSVLHQWQAVINPTSKDFILDENNIMETAHSLSALLSALCTDTVTRFGIKRNITILPYEKILLLLTVLQLFFISLTLLFLRTLPFKTITDKKHLFVEFSYLMLIVPLIFPHQQKHGFVMILPAVAFIWFRVLEKKQAGVLLKNIIALMIIIWLLTTTSTDGIIGKEMYEYGQYFKLITWGTILLIVPLLKLTIDS